MMRSYNVEDSAALPACVAALAQEGSLLLAPTETVYGLMCSWPDQAARERIYSAKRRDGRKPLQMLAADLAMVEAGGGVVTETARRLAAEFCPGPLTVVIDSADGGSLGFRIPGHAFVLAVIRGHGKPLAATSANLSGEPAALGVPEALASLAEPPDLAVDGGALPADSLASTVVDARGGGLKILREGTISLAELERAVKA